MKDFVSLMKKKLLTNRIMVIKAYSENKFTLKITI